MSEIGYQLFKLNWQLGLLVGRCEYWTNIM